MTSDDRRWHGVWLPDASSAEWDHDRRAWVPVIRYRLHVTTDATQVIRQNSTHLTKASATLRAAQLAEKSLFGGNP